MASYESETISTSSSPWVGWDNKFFNKRNPATLSSLSDDSAESLLLFVMTNEASNISSIFSIYCELERLLLRHLWSVISYEQQNSKIETVIYK